MASHTIRFHLPAPSMSGDGQILIRGHASPMKDPLERARAALTFTGPDVKFERLVSLLCVDAECDPADRRLHRSLGRCAKQSRGDRCSHILTPVQQKLLSQLLLHEMDEAMRRATLLKNFEMELAKKDKI